MKFNEQLKVLIVGLGVIGGSYAMALKKKGFAVTAIERNEKSLEYAVQNGWIDTGSIEPDPALIAEADLIVSALYPHTFIRWVQQNQPLFKSGAVLTDVTGVKGGIVEAIQGLLRTDVEFIAAHPMAGREKSGALFADARVFEGANFIVVPTDKNTDEGIEFCKALGRTLGFGNISVLTPEKHDQMIAFLSQLTHCIAVSLMCACEDEGVVNYTGDSFRDLTRIAKINENMWSELFLWNKSALLAEMERFRAAFDKLETALRQEDGKTMRQMMRLSTQRRELFDRKEETK